MCWSRSQTKSNSPVNFCGFLQISMDFYGISMISTDFQRFLWISTDFQRFLWISVDLYRIFHEFRWFGDPILVDFKEEKSSRWLGNHWNLSQDSPVLVDWKMISHYKPNHRPQIQSFLGTPWVDVNHFLNHQIIGLKKHVKPARLPSI